MERHRYILLLVALLIMMIVSPMLSDIEFADFSLNLLFSIIILAAVNAASERRSHLLFALSLAIFWVFLQFFGSLFRIPYSSIMEDSAKICLLYFTVYIILRPLLRAEATDFNMLCGAISGYLLIGIAWAVSYNMFETLLPGSYTLMDPDSEVWSQLLYFSLTTLTTLGYGDLKPLTPLAGIWATLEAVAGTLYVAVLVARLVSIIRG